MRKGHHFFYAVATAALVSASHSIVASGNAPLADHVWIHGAQDCSASDDPAIETFKFDEDTYILRQSKCLNFEAPFIYVLFGSHTVFIQDTGATSDPESFPLYDTIVALARSRSPGSAVVPNMLVTHSHSHADHRAADGQFEGKPTVTVIAPSKQGVAGFLSSLGAGAHKSIDLGDRQLTLFAIPGHQAESLAVYDPHTKWLLTGDTVYPGIISVLDWNQYLESVDRLVAFSDTHAVSAVLGSHIEMSKTRGVPYERGTPYQPNEASLVLTPAALTGLKLSLDKTDGEPQEVSSGSIIVRPVPWPARALIGFLRFFGAG